MEISVETGNFDVDNYKRLFINVMDLLDQNCDENVFRNERNTFVPALFEAITLGIAENIEQYTQDPDMIKEKVRILKTDGEFKRFSGSASNSRSRIKNRLRRVSEVFGNNEE